MRGVAVVLILLMAGPVWGANLLANPGFDELDGTKPAHWDLYIAPQEGALGAPDGAPLDGEYCAMIHIPQPYAQEPYNNWSQPVFGDFGGKTLRVSGHIRTVNATDASLWVQCFRKTPWGVLAVARTSERSPRSGTSGWDRVETTVDVPEGTDYVMVRCVLKGRGTAWFDSLRLEDLAEEQDMLEGLEQLPAPAQLDEAPDGRAAHNEAASPLPANTAGHVEKLLAAQEELLESHRELAKMNEQLRTRLQVLEAEVGMLREQMKVLQSLGLGRGMPGLPSMPDVPLVPGSRLFREGGGGL